MLPENLLGIRDQLWAEAVTLFRSGSPWWLDSSELVGLAAAEQAYRFEGDPVGWVNRDLHRRSAGCVDSSGSQFVLGEAEGPVAADG
jgi:hypothetical protein